LNQKLWAIVLAAGESKRMGRPKMLLPFGEKTIIENVIAAILESTINKVLVVLGAKQDKVLEKIRDLPIRTVVNPSFQQGMLSSVQAGFKALPQEAVAALVLLGDQPSVSPSVIDRIREAFLASEKSIVVPTFQNQRGHPVLIAAKFCDEIQNLSPNVGLRQLLHDHPAEILEVSMEDEQILQDIDNVQDYRNAVKKQKKRLD
jgi:molybdenum cofactor cytidylyltransferase